MDNHEETVPSRASRQKGEGRKKTLRTVGLVLAVVLVLAAIGFAVYGLVTHAEFTAVLRDIFIIVLALVTIIIGLFLVILVFQLQSLIALLRDEIKPILESANQTASTVRGTTTFVSDAVVSPLISAASYASAVRETVKVLAGGNRRRKKDAAPLDGSGDG
jgi:heme/copper-type cytochrome/quinol oxidase subunit 4